MKRFLQIVVCLASLLAPTAHVGAASPQTRGLAFSWGAGLTGDVDMSQHNMSSLGLNFEAGMSWKWIRFLGAGVEGDFMVSNSGKSYPIFINFRTDFSNFNRLVFMDLRGGISINTLEGQQKTGAYASAGVGVTLAEGKKFSSHLILAYTYLSQDVCYNGDYIRKCPGISMATLRLGVNFNIGAKKRADTQVLPKQPEFAKSESTNVPVNYASNRIELPQGPERDKWRTLSRNVRNAAANGEKIDIIVVGDSHTQAEMATSRLRRILQDKYGNGGRGLIIPFRMAGTNQPTDYTIKSTLPVDSQARLLARPWPITPGFTGVAASTNLSNKITFRNLEDGHDFTTARIFTSEGENTVNFPEPVDSATLSLFPHEKLYGIYSVGNRPGIVLSAIGNNGACSSDYLSLSDFGRKVSTFSPQLIIVALGTNEAYSDKSDTVIIGEATNLINELRENNPGAAMMLVTPMESGKKNSDSFETNRRVAEVRNLLLGVARNNNVAIWDFYDIAGGNGSSDKWVEAGMMNPRDHIHLLKSGYTLQGELLSDALIKLFESQEMR